MKNFCEAIDIKKSLTLRMVLILETIGSPQVYLEINNDTVLDQMLDHQILIVEDLPIGEGINIYLKLIRTHPDAVNMSMTIDGFEVLPKYQQHLNLPGCYLDQSSTTVISIPNFYPWYHEITGQGWIA